MRKRIEQFFLPILLILSLSACNLELVESPADADILLTITANAALIEAGKAQPGTEEPLQLEGDVAPPADEVVLPAEVLPPAVGDVTVTVSVATNCRQGPGAAFASVYGMPVGQVAKVIAKNESSGYWIIEIPGQNGQSCWLWGQYATVTGDTTTLKIAVVPASPATATPTAAKASAPTATQSSSSGSSPGSGAITGCTANSPNANPRDGLDSCYQLGGPFSVTGCMDPNASNYDSKATVDSGFCTYTKPKAPTLGVSFVNCTPAANGQMTYAVTLAWTDNSNNETGFNIFTNLSLRAENANSTSSSFTETYPAGTVLNVSLTAYNNAGQSRSATTSFTCNAKPKVPTFLSATCTGTPDGQGNAHYTYQVSWADNSNNEDGFTFSGPEGTTGYSANSTFHSGSFDWFAPPMSIDVTVTVYNSEGSVRSDLFPITCN